MNEPGKDDILKVHNRIGKWVHRTPVLTSSYINSLIDGELFIKCENFQKVGAFKARGALNALFAYLEDHNFTDVATHSSGNHAQAVAWAASIKGIKAHIVMPSTAPMVKKAAVKGYGATIYECEPTLKARETTLEAVVQDTGAQVIHPFNDIQVIAGQATAAVELMDEIPDLDNLITPVGGGGLLSGTALAAKYFSQRTIKVFAGEPMGADDAWQSMRAGKMVLPESPKTIADGLLTALGSLTYPIIKEHVSEIIRVDDREIISAMRLMWERMKIVVEPSGAVPLAAILKHSNSFRERRTGVIISGGNIDLSHFFEGLT